VTAAFSHVLAFTAAAAVLVATPGLDTAVVLRQAAVEGQNLPPSQPVAS
jgi:threonine/homoserine/homoserine lactone efflux protein